MTEQMNTATMSSVGATSVTLSNDLIRALGSLNVQAEGFGSTRINNGVADFRITGGSADLDDTKVEIIHSGGLRLKAANTVVDLTDFTISNFNSNLNDRAVLTGLVAVNGDLVTRAPLFNLQLGGVETSTQDDLTNLNLKDVDLTLTRKAAATLNQVFGVRAFQRGFNIGTALVDAFVNPATGDIEAVSQKQSSIGKTSVTLSSDLVNALGALNVQAEGFGGTKINSGIAAFGITGGAADLDTSKVEIVHSGGLTLKAGNTTVNLSDFVISNLGDSRSILTGLVTVNGDLVTRAPLFDLQGGELDTSTSEDLTNLDLKNVAVKLKDEAASVLNQAFGVTAFTAGFNIGTANVDAFVNPANGDIVESAGEQLKVGSAPDSSSDMLANSPSDRTSGSTRDITEAGETSVALSTDLVNALSALNLQAEGFGSTEISNGVADFLITGGAADLDTTKVEIIHGGGLTLKSANTAVDLTDFAISNLGDRSILTGLVTVNGDLVSRAPLFDLQLGSVTTSTQGSLTNLDLENVGVRLRSEAATTLNQAFGINAFTPGFNIGTASVDAFIA
ncbi:MAG: hypothetical protein HC942_13810 [Microcoleus sp. SU_5_6]|nr:hypothetical protein [Microcoleus sp. SU_5_6]NJL67076.1 hypothetical protein [Microcoleus sp. SM1_3_4]